MNAVTLASASVEPVAPVDLEVAQEAERALVRAAVGGSAAAFESLVQSHHVRVFGYLCHLTRHRQDAEDLTQQTFIKAFRNLDRFDCSRPLINWLLTIARRTALNHFRSARKWEGVPAELPSKDPSPAQNAETLEYAENIWASARRILTQREFEVLWLRFGEELSIKETAEIVGLTQIHVKVIVHRARQRLLKGELRS